MGKAGQIIIDRTKVVDGQKFSEQAAAMAGPMQANAARNAAAMKAELAAPRRVVRKDRSQKTTRYAPRGIWLLLRICGRL